MFYKQKIFGGYFLELMYHRRGVHNREAKVLLKWLKSIGELND